MIKFYEKTKEYRGYVHNSSPNKEEYTENTLHLVFDEANKDFFFPFTYKPTDHVKSDLSYEEARLLFFKSILLDLNAVECEVAEEDGVTMCYTLDRAYYQGQPFSYFISLREYGDRLAFNCSLYRENDSPLMVQGGWQDINPSNMRESLELLITNLKELTLLIRRFIAFEGDEND